jgi:hypothetical protein
VPGELIVTKPGNGNTASPQAIVGIDPVSGLLVEDNGAVSASSPLEGSSPALYYNNVLGAGTGAVGLPQPSSAVDSKALASGQYLGFVYSAGAFTGISASAWSSHLVSFGFAAVPSSCGALTGSSSTLLYGGDFDPSKSADGYGNCDLAIDLGAQDAKNNGLFPHAEVRIGAAYPGNSMAKTDSFSAVVIAGQLNGKFALFLIGVDATQPWAAYLLQSN